MYYYVYLHSHHGLWRAEVTSANKNISLTWLAGVNFRKLALPKVCMRPFTEDVFHGDSADSVSNEMIQACT